MKKWKGWKIILLCIVAVCTSKTAAFAESRIGGYFIYDKAVLHYDDFVKHTMGGGISGETGLLSWRFATFGISGRAEAVAITPSSDDIVVSSLIFFSAGMWMRFPFGKSGISFQPEFSYGVVFADTKTNEGHPEPIAIDTYADQVFQVSASLRYAFKKLPVEIEVTPLFSFSPEKVDGVHLAGCRAGLLFCFGREPYKKISVK